MEGQLPATREVASPPPPPLRKDSPQNRTPPKSRHFKRETTITKGRVQVSAVGSETSALKNRTGVRYTEGG